GSINHAAPYPGTMTGFSSRGPSALDPSQYFPDITAPGENIRSSVPGGGYEGGWSGTSMAGPHATALVGLIWSANPALRGQVEQTIQIIRDTATPVTSYVGSCGGNYVTGPNNDWGYGTINALAAVQEAVAMGGAGQLDGHVTDATTGDPIEGANIHAAHSEGFSWDDLTDPTGFYTMTVASGTYVVTATSYGYFDEVASPVVVVTDSLTVQDFALDPLPVFTISGHVIDSVTGDPLEATVGFTDAPVPPVTTDPAGFYSLNVAQGTYHLQVTSNLHQPETREVVVNDNLTEDFLLNPLPCILVVDDDQDGPDVRSQYTTALDDLGLGYNVWDTGDDGEPAATDLAGYRHLVWFTGYPYSNTFNGTNEAAVSAYMDAGGNFFLSSQDYLYEEGLTSFGQNYLHILSFTSDVNQTTVTGQNVFSGLGPYTLNYPFTNYSDIVNPDGQALTAFTGNQGNTAVSFDGTNFNSVFFGFPFEALPTLTSRSAVMSQIVSYFGGCEPPVDVTITPSAQSQTGEPGAQVSYAYTVTNDSNIPQDITLGIASNWPTEAPTSTGELAGGASTVVTVTVTIPTMPQVIIGSDTFTLSATGVVGGYDEATGTTYANV
ncbi:MAG TPA: carboxypeptidase regulatory-like domain-containing protein, partial [Anaerolineales bacterium]